MRSFFSRDPRRATRTRLSEPPPAVPGRRTLIDGAAAASSPSGVDAAARHALQGPATSLPHLDTIQRAFGAHDVRGIQAHTDEHAAAGTGALGALGFARGDQVAFAGAPSLHTAAHEAAHVVQRRDGVRLKVLPGLTGDPYEAHADAVADRVVRGESAEELLSAHAGPALGRPAGGPASIRRKPVAQATPGLYIDDVTGQSFTLVKRDERHGGRMLLKGAGGLVWFYDRGPASLYLAVADADALERAFEATVKLASGQPGAKDLEVEELFGQALAIANDSPEDAARWLADYGHAIAGSGNMQKHGIEHGGEFERAFLRLEAVARGTLDAVDLAELRIDATRVLDSDGAEAAVDWLETYARGIEALQQLHLDAEPEPSPEPASGPEDRREPEASAEQPPDESDGARTRPPTVAQAHQPATVTPDIPPPPELTAKIPLDVWQHIVGFLARGDRRLLGAVRATSKKLYSAAENSITGEVWYGKNSVQNNTTRHLPRPPGQVDPMIGRVTGQAPGELREGPCEALCGQLVTTMEQNAYGDPCMVGVLLGMSGTLYVTVSGTVPGPFVHIAGAVLRGEQVRIVRDGSVAPVAQGGSEQFSINGKDVKGYGGKLKGTFTNHPGGSATGEVAKTPPGTCALPKLIDACRANRDTPKYASEKRYAPKRDQASIVRVLDRGAVREHGHGASVPSCVNCRPLTSAQVEGVENHESAAIDKGIKDRELLRKIEQSEASELAARDKRTASAQEEEERHRSTYKIELTEKAKAAVAIPGTAPVNADCLETDWTALALGVTAWIEQHCELLAQNPGVDPAGDPAIGKLAAALKLLVAALGAVDPGGSDGWAELSQAEHTLLALIGFR